MIETVLGAISEQELGITMCHEHLAMDLSPVRGDFDSLFNNEALIGSELKKLKDQGCKAIVEVSCNGMGRDVLQLQRYSKAHKLHIIASTGFYLYPYHSEWLHSASVEDIAELFMKELTEGIENTEIRAGIIAEIATSKEKIYDSEKKVFEAAGIASQQTNCAVSTHCDMGTRGMDQIELLCKAGMKPNKIILGHTDLSNDTGYQIALLQSGVNLAFDTISKIKYLSDEHRADNFAALIEQGYEDHLLLSQDVSRLSYMTANGGFGYTAVLGYFMQLLRQRGVNELQLEKILVKNPARILNR